MPQIDKLLFFEQMLFLFVFFLLLSPIAFVLTTEKTILEIKKVQRWLTNQRLFF